ncbi:MAG: imidazolonepropionase-like domain-containing protein, partial [Rickettsiales bacterium]
MPDTTQWDSLYIHANLLTMAGVGEIRDGAIAVKDGRIAWVGTTDALSGKAKETHDVQGAWITPGLIDCHTHLVYGGNRAKEFEMRLEGATYAEIAQAGGGI